MPKLSLTLFLLAAGCSSATFKVVTEPIGAEIFVATQTGEKRAVGKSPLELPIEDIENAWGLSFANQPFVQVSIEKQGFSSEVFQLPSPRMSSGSTELTVKMKESKESQDTELTAKKVLDQIFLAQKLAMAEQFERAQIELDKVIEKFPQFARALSMRASIYYAQKNYAEAVKWYEAAISADPQFEEAVRLLAKAKTSMGDRMPASRGNP